MKISRLDVLTACWHAAQHNSDYSNIGKIEHELAKYIQNNHNLSKEEFFLKYINRTINISFHYCPVKAGKSVFEIVET